MNAVKMAAVVLIAAGVLALVYGSFSYTKDTHEAKLGPIELSVKDKKTVNIPVWAGRGGGRDWRCPSACRWKERLVAAAPAEPDGEGDRTAGVIA